MDYPNTLRILTHTAKTAFHPAVSSIYFEDNMGAVWKVTIDTRFKRVPVPKLRNVTKHMPDNWRDLSADEIDLVIAQKFLDSLPVRED
jgi:hypothetical protein